jgi:protease-4
MRASFRHPLSSLAALLLFAPMAHAESPKVAPLVLAPGHGAASSDDADSIVRNPANLGFLPAFDLRYTGRFCPAASVATSCGHGFGVAAPLAFGLSGGLRYDYLSSGSGVPASFPSEVGWLSYALALAPSKAMAYGVSIRHAYSESTALDGRYGIGASASYRPLSLLGLSVIGQDLNASGSTASGLTPWFERSVTFAAAVRPFGTNAFDVGLEAKRYGTTPGWFVRGTGSFAIPYVGRLRLEAEDRAGDLTDSRWALYAGLDIGLGPATITGGATRMPSDDDRLGLVVGASLSGVRDEGLPLPARAVRLRIDGTPSNRGHMVLLRKLWRLSESPDVAAVALDLDAEPASTSAHAEEIADAVRVLKARGKKVVCAIEDGGTRSMQACADADHVSLMRGGNLRWLGFRAQYIYMAEALDKVGVHWEYERIGAHKTAPEQFGRMTGSAEAHADYTALLEGQEGAFVTAVARGRKLTPGTVRELATKGPFGAEDALAAKLIDSLAYDDEIDATVHEVVGRKIHVTSHEVEPMAPQRFGTPRRLAVLWIDGDIVDGKSTAVPFVGMHTAGSDTIAESARQLEEDASVGAVVVRIESPGGSTVASEKIWHALARLAKKKPVVASLGSMAASGGYYAAAACPTIVATPTTVTGSIGVFFAKPEIATLLNRIGIGVDTYRTTSRADAESILRPFTAEERIAIHEKVEQSYSLFLDRVSAGRKLDKSAVDAVAQGRVWTGQDAHGHKLVDRLGGFREALDLAYSLGHVPHSAPVVELPRADGSLIQQALGAVAYAPASAASPVYLTREAQRLARATAALWLHDASNGVLRTDVSVDDEGSDDLIELRDAAER